MTLKDVKEFITYPPMCIIYGIVIFLVLFLAYMQFVTAPAAEKFWDKEKSYIDTLNCVDLGKYLVKQSLNYSGMYLQGELYTLKDVKEMTESGHLLDNMRMNNWDKVVKTRFGQFFPLENGDVLLT